MDWLGPQPGDKHRQRTGESTRQRLVRHGGDNRVDFQPGELTDIAKDEAPLLLDTAEMTKDGLYSMDADEHSMLLDVARGRGGLGDEPAPKSRRTDRNGSDSVNGAVRVDGARGEYKGCRNTESLTPLHQVLPYGSQFRDTTSSAGHAWVNADIRDDEQVKNAVAQVEAAVRRHTGAQPLILSAYSDGSVTGKARGSRELRARGTSASCGPSGALKIVYQKHNKR